MISKISPEIVCAAPNIPSRQLNLKKQNMFFWNEFWATKLTGNSIRLSKSFTKHRY